MNLETFNNSDIATKGTIVFGKNSQFIGYRQYYGQKLVLYDCGEFFAETYYDPETNEITKIEGFAQDDKRIDRYIEFMNVLEKKY